MYQDDEDAHRQQDVHQAHDDIVCFVSGEGKVVIRGENYKKQLSKRSKHCKHLIDPKNNKIDYVAMVEKGVGAIVGVSQEGVVHGVSRKAVTIIPIVLLLIIIP